jgi:hypothetical protein
VEHPNDLLAACIDNLHRPAAAQAQVRSKAPGFQPSARAIEKSCWASVCSIAPMLMSAKEGAVFSIIA